jgi:hypothetical protein
MDKMALLKRLSEERYEYFATMGLSPVKCRQLVAEKLDVWKNMPVEELQRIMDAEDFGS